MMRSSPRCAPVLGSKGSGGSGGVGNGQGCDTNTGGDGGTVGGVGSSIDIDRTPGLVRSRKVGKYRTAALDGSGKQAISGYWSRVTVGMRQPAGSLLSRVLLVVATSL